MTEDYKKSLIDYVSGLLKIEQEKPTDFDPYEMAGVGDRDYNGVAWEEVIIALRDKNVSINGILENENYDLFIMYGGYQEENSGNSKGFLIYIDEYNKPINIKLLDHRGFQYLEFDESSNRVYGVVGDRANYPVANDNDAYFVYYNNLFLTYEDGVDPEQTYAYKIWEDSSNNYFMCRDIQKNPENSYYLIYATAFTNLHSPIVMELRINVGEANELKTWNIGSTYFGYAFYGWYSGETPHFRVIAFDYNGNHDFYLTEDNGDNINYTQLTCDTTIDNPQVSYIKNDYVSINENEIYFVYNSSVVNDNKTYKQSCLYQYDGTSIKTLYKTDSLDYTTNHNIPILNVLRDGNTIYAIKTLSSEQDLLTIISVVNISQHPTPLNTDFEELNRYNGYIYRFNTYNFRSVLKRNFNIVYFNSFCGYIREGLGDYTQDVNGFCNQDGLLVQRFGYNGFPYSSYNVLQPRYVNMYYLNVALMFSRNVYNITRFENTSTASVEIPARYLNNYVMSRQKLFGATCYNLIDNLQPISKNQYEIVHVNFINTINVIDEDTGIYYKQGAIKVNNCATIGTQATYNIGKCTKYRINYNDGTTLVGNITWENINATNKKTKFVIYVDKAIDNIDLLSNDGTSIYMKINGTFTIGNYYTIKQKVRIGDKPQLVDLQYNGENVLYNNEQVQVIV